MKPLYSLSVDLQFFAGEKTEKATPRKRQDSRKKGQVAKSADLTGAFALFAMFLMLSFLGPFIGKQLFTLTKDLLGPSYLLTDLSNGMAGMLVDLLLRVGLILAPFFIVAVVFGVLVNYLQIGPLFSTEAIQPKLERIDPLKGVKRIVSMKAVVEFLKSLFKLLMILTTAVTVLWQNQEKLSRMAVEHVRESIVALASMTIELGLWVSVALLALALFDFFYQRFDFEKSIRMSKQDIKDEYKNSEGDPLIKSKIKQQQREMAMRRMMQEIPNADVVITNPTHFAVVIRYDDQKDFAPLVVAKGVDRVAFHIRDVAKEHEIPIVENKPLARALYAQMEIGEVVDESFYQAIAEVLAFVYQLKQPS
ncbi:flagellar biosynthesis protein FlhB [Exiguobacterium sp.]|uniref:flagellar biosynthesis protein FlhB n=1 Tax=Exiguobacterium sp. TaxID=44751 RepID=UPI00263B5573|nr:flagellar biosynthesis protein FlhB [Exiguobacterium sp.]MCC5892258.1 flagellar biosynthesis protein FlhB [Exiguobacterium sp.]